MPSSAGNAVSCCFPPLKARCSWSTGTPPICRNHHKRSAPTGGEPLLFFTMRNVALILAQRLRAAGCGSSF